MEWIHQAEEAVKHAIQRCVTQLSGTPPPIQLDRYAFPARTPEQIKADMAAEQAAVAPETSEEDLRDPMKESNGSPPIERHDDGPVSWML